MKRKNKKPKCWYKRLNQRFNMQEILIASACFFPMLALAFLINSTVAIYLLLVGGPIYALIVAHACQNPRSRKKLRVPATEQKNTATEPGLKAHRLMMGLERTNWYEELPLEIRNKSLFGKRD